MLIQELHSTYEITKYTTSTIVVTDTITVPGPTVIKGTTTVVDVSRIDPRFNHFDAL